MINEKCAIELVNAHNEDIDDYYNGELKEQLGLEEGQPLTIELWFKANHLIMQKGFYKRGMAIVKALRSQGYDVKIDAQTEKISWYGLL